MLGLGLVYFVFAGWGHPERYGEVVGRWGCLSGLPAVHAVAVYLPWLAVAAGAEHGDHGAPWWQHLTYALVLAIAAPSLSMFVVENAAGLEAALAKIKVPVLSCCCELPQAATMVFADRWDTREVGASLQFPKAPPLPRRIQLERHRGCLRESLRCGQVETHVGDLSVP